MTKSPHNS